MRRFVVLDFLQWLGQAAGRAQDLASSRPLHHRRRGSVGRVRLIVSRSLRHAVRNYLRRHRHYRVMVHLGAVMAGPGAPQRVGAVLPIWTYPGFR